MNKKTGIIIGFALIAAGLAGAVYCLLHVNSAENAGNLATVKFELIASGAVFVIGLLVTNLSIFSNLKAKREAETAALRAKLEAENLLLFDANLSGTVTYLDFRRPGAYSAWRKVGLSGGTIALTAKRLLALNGAATVIDVPVTDPRFHQMKFSLEDGPKLCIAFDAGLFQPEWSGNLEYRFKTAQAGEFVKKINELKGTPDGAPSS